MKQLLPVVATLALALPVIASGQARISVPASSEGAKSAAAAVRAAEDAGDAARVLSESRKWLEFYPNEPLVQSAILKTMAEAAATGGDAALAQQYNAASQAVDPGGAGRVEKAAGDPAAVRGKGNKLAKVTAAFSVALATLTAVAEAREQVRAASQPQMQPGGMGYPGGQMPPGGMGQPGGQMAPGGMGQPGGQMPPGGMPYPTAPYGAPGYQPPPGDYAPMPGYGPPPGAGMPQGGAPGGYPPQGQMPQGQMPQGQMPAYPPPGYAMPVDPYRPPPGYAPPTGYRGAAAPSFRVLHDHAVSGDAAHFGKGCGALLTVQGSSIVFTPGGAEAPRVIPASDVLEVRLNSTVGRDIGAFHILTKKGLYLHLAPESGKVDDARAAVEALRKASTPER